MQSNQRRPYAHEMSDALLFSYI